MSVENVMNTMASQDATSSLGVDSIGSSLPSGQTGTGKPTVKGIDDVFNIYSGTEDDTAASKNGVELKEDEKNIPDELNNKAKDAKGVETKKEETEEEKTEETPKEETLEDPKKEEQIDNSKTVKVKVNGVEKEVPLQDVINSYSGQQEIQRRFTEFDKQKKAFEAEKTELVKFNDYAKNELQTVRAEFDQLVRQFETSGTIEKDPLNAINQLLDKMGINSNTYNRALFEHMLPEYAKFFNMTDVERDAYFTRKENEYLRKKDQAINERSQQLKTQEEKRQKDYEFIRSSGLDDVQYESIKSELLDAGAEGLTPQQVVEYAKQKPTLERVVKISEEAKLDLSDQKVIKVKEILTRFPDTTDDEILSVLIPDRAAINASKVLQEKKPVVKRAPVQTNEDKELEEQLNFYRR